MIRSKGEVVRGNQRAREVTLEPAAFHLTFTSLPRAPLPCNPRTWRASFLQYLGKQTALQKSTLSPCRTEEWGRNQEFSQDATNVDHSLKPHGRIWDWSTLWLTPTLTLHMRKLKPRNWISLFKVTWCLGDVLVPFLLQLPPHPGRSLHAQTTIFP